MNIDRRHSRSSFRCEALDLALRAAAQRANAPGAVIADADGFVVATAGATMDPDVLAAMSAVAIDGRPSATRRLQGALPSPLRVASLRVQDATLFCAWLGDHVLDTVALEATLDRIVASSAN